MRIILYQPDIPQNTGTILRLAACLNICVDIIEPAGFALSERALRRAGLDYMAHADMTRHMNFEHFQAQRKSKANGRLILLTTRAELAYSRFSFRRDDNLLFGRESAGVPESVHAACDARLVIPVAPGRRSLNVAIACAMVVGEALRQTGGFPRANPRGEDPA